MVTQDKIAVFDFDGTLTKHDTFVSFAKFAVGKRRFYLSIMKTFPWLVLWKLRVISNGNVKQKLFQNLYEDMAYEDFAEYGRLFSSHIDGDLNPKGMAYLKRHLEQGHKTYIVSASIQEWIAPWAAAKGIAGVVATKPMIDHGRLTGRFSTPNCHGKEKVKRAMEEIPELEKYEWWAYGDSPSDRFILEASTHPLFIR